MVQLKRPIPPSGTPSPQRSGPQLPEDVVVQSKKRLRAYASPLRAPPLKVATTTPLKQELTPISARTAAPSNGAIASPDGATLRLTPRRQHPLSRSREEVLSPAAAISPRANLPSSALKTSGALKVEGVGGPSLLIQAARAAPTPNLDDLKRARAATRQLAKSQLPPKDRKELSPAKPTLEQMNAAFEEWMRISADNKINAKNSWNFALIDYFSELTFLRDGDSINFQKASCTLDGCVKIYSSRVDSVAEQTEKLLTGLAPGQVQSSSSGADAEQAEGKEAEEDTVKTRRSRKRATDSFLEKNPDTLILRTFDQESTPDPLFKKMTQQFDELQGTVGLLQTLLPMECETLSLVLDPAMPLRNIYYATARSDHNDVSDLTLNAKTALGKYAHH